MAESQHEKSISGIHVATPKYGENPWQETSGLYANPENQDPLAINRFVLEQGTPPSYNNYADIDRLLQTITHIAAGFDLNQGFVPHIALGAKHGNMCGGSVDKGRVPTTEEMLEGDLQAIFGGSVMLNFPITDHVAETLLQHEVEDGRKRLLDVVTAPTVDKKVLELLERKEGKLRILTNQALGKLSIDSLDSAERFRYVRGGFLAQQNYTYVPDFRSTEWLQTNEVASRELEQDLLLAWAIGSTSTSNTITLVKNGTLIGNGVGQQDRVTAAKFAIARAEQAGYSTEGSVAYSDSFFPFPDGPEVLADAGVKAIFTSSGSINDDKVFETFSKKGVQVFSSPDKEVRGFYGH